MMKTVWGDGSLALSLGRLHPIDVSRMPFGTNATHDPIGIPKSLWARRKSLGAAMNSYKMIGMNT